MLKADFWHVCAELRQMRIKAETDKKEAALAESSMKSIESAARKAYEKDLAAQQANASANGDWVRPPTIPALVATSISTLLSWSLQGHTENSPIPCSELIVSLLLQVFDDASGHHYNAAQRYYHNR
jgi:hypothetical protein